LMDSLYETDPPRQGGSGEHARDLAGFAVGRLRGVLGRRVFDRGRARAGLGRSIRISRATEEVAHVEPKTAVVPDAAAPNPDHSSDLRPHRRLVGAASAASLPRHQCQKADKATDAGLVAHSFRIFSRASRTSLVALRVS